MSTTSRTEWLNADDIVVSSITTDYGQPPHTIVLTDPGGNVILGIVGSDEQITKLLDRIEGCLDRTVNESGSAA